MQITRLFEILEHQEKNYEREDSLAHKVNGSWKTWSTSEVIKIVNQLSLGLLELGIKAEDKIAIISMNRPEWNFVDFAIQQIGAISVPMYPTITADDYSYILKDSETKMIFVSDHEIHAKAKIAAERQDREIPIYSFEKIVGANYWADVQYMGATRSENELDPYKEKVKETDLMTIIYTSGTTGNPKGVMLSHKNILSNVKSSLAILPDLGTQPKALSFLPLCHVYERMLSNLYLISGLGIYYAESMETIGENLKEVKPAMFSTVPRLLEKVYDKIYAKGCQLTGVKKKLFFWALNLGMKYRIEKDKGFFYNLQLKLANKLIFSKWREALGGNVKIIVSGSAALQPRLSKIFWAANIFVLEGYGLTETSPVISVNFPDPKQTKFGTVGVVVDGVEVKIAPSEENPSEGEILTKGPHVMMGYYKKPEKTKEVIKDGWFHTGDIGTIVDQKFLKITGRKKEIFKTSGGKYISPGLMENKFKESTFIEQIMVIGEFKRFPAALIVPSFDKVKEWCEKENIPYTTDSEIINHPQVIEKFEQEKERLNKNYASFEKIKQIRLLPQAWTVESGEITPTLKCKRKVINKNCETLINDIYEKEYEI